MSDTTLSSASAQFPVLRRTATQRVSRAEGRLLGFIVATWIFTLFNQAVRKQEVEWSGFLPVILVSLELVLIGACIRRNGRFARLSMGLIGFGLYICFSMSSAVFVFTIFPFVNPIVDQNLIAIDAAFGFSWVPFVEYVATFPKFGLALRQIYMTILPQLAFAIILLSFLKRQEELLRFLTVGFVGMVLTNAIWWLFPSVGPAAYAMVSAEAQDRILLVANAAYGADMHNLATKGLSVITQDHITGVIAFPSFHIVLTLLVLRFTYRTIAFYPLVALNLLMPVATVVHGGHHVVDLFGGLAVFGVSLWIGNWLLSGKMDGKPKEMRA